MPRLLADLSDLLALPSRTRRGDRPALVECSACQRTGCPVQGQTLKAYPTGTRLTRRVGRDPFAL